MIRRPVEFLLSDLAREIKVWCKPLILAKFENPEI
jgi:hypothetical protein